MNAKFTTTSKGTWAYIQKSVRKNGKSTTLTIKRLGLLSDIQKREGCADPRKWVEDLAVRMTQEEKSSNKRIEIELSPNALGVAGLKYFLEYAASGTMSETTSIRAYAENHDSVLAKLHKLVGDAGYEFYTNVGGSNFKVDIAIKDPDVPNRYILGLLLDGYAYYQIKTIRDREIVQPNVLKLLNRNIHKDTMDIRK